jgi:hypothetical protein
MIKSLKSLIGFESKRFALLWRGSRDGFEPSAFHRYCDGKANTLTVIKNSLGYVFGGYTAVPWSAPSFPTYKSDSTAFLFSLTNPANNPLRLKVIKPEEAVVHYSDSGLIFGGGYDLTYDSFDSDHYNCMSFKSYQSPTGLKGDEGGKYVLGGSNHKYKVLEIEIFQAVA